MLTGALNDDPGVWQTFMAVGKFHNSVNGAFYGNWSLIDGGNIWTPVPPFADEVLITSDAASPATLLVVPYWGIDG